MLLNVCLPALQRPLDLSHCPSKMDRHPLLPSVCMSSSYAAHMPVTYSCPSPVCRQAKRSVLAQESTFRLFSMQPLSNVHKLYLLSILILYARYLKCL